MLGSALPPDVRYKAVALPRRRWCFDIWSYALGVAYGPVGPKGQARARGLAREQSICCRRGKPCLTFGGIAEDSTNDGLLGQSRIGAKLPTSAFLSDLRESVFP